MGDLEDRSRRLSRRAARLEEAELDRLAEQRAEERLLRTAISRMSTDELEAMREHFNGKEEEGWTEEDRPLMLRLLEIKEEVRRCKRRGTFRGGLPSENERVTPDHDEETEGFYMPEGKALGEFAISRTRCYLPRFFWALGNPRAELEAERSRARPVEQRGQAKPAWRRRRRWLGDR